MSHRSVSPVGVHCITLTFIVSAAQAFGEGCSLPSRSAFVRTLPPSKMLVLSQNLGGGKQHHILQLLYPSSISDFLKTQGHILSPKPSSATSWALHLADSLAKPASVLSPASLFAGLHWGTDIILPLSQTVHKACYWQQL